MKRIFSRISLIRLGLLVGAVTIIMLALPRAGHQSYSYELNQPWKYHLLTADFDIPVYRDTETARKLHDSIEVHFIPFVVRQDEIAKNNISRFRSLAGQHIGSSDVNLMASILTHIYTNGLMEQSLHDSIQERGQTTLRTVQDSSDDPTTATFIDATIMMSPPEAFQYADSAYRHSTHGQLMPEQLAKALSMCLQPNVALDSVTDGKFRNQEYLNVNAAMGIIKKGQRIVDLGEIVTPQIYTNLHTYEGMLQEKQLDTSRNYFTYGEIAYILLIFVVFYLYLAQFRPRYYRSSRVMTFLMVFITLFVIFAVFMFESFNYGIYVVPFAAVPITVLLFLDARTAVMSLITTVFVAAVVATFQFQFVVLELMAGFVACFSMKQLSKRSQLFAAALLAFVVYVFAYTILHLLESGNLSAFSWRIIGMLGANCVLLSFAFFMILLIEKIFGFTSELTLVELSDINNHLLRRLAEEAPGTFQHSMQVSTLAAEAARAIGANVQMVRTGALYHDIGKLSSPVFFTENQHGVNPHDGLTPEASAHKIISHVQAGLQLASKEKLPALIKSFISEHHGRGMARYFYTVAKNENRNVNPADFTYPGPDPQTKETTLLMMADAVEAASRSLKDYSEESIGALVDKIIDGQIADGRYKDSPISFNDIETVKRTFKTRLATIYHSRVAYPEEKK